MVLQVKQNNRENINKKKAIEETMKQDEIRVTVDLSLQNYREIKVICATSDRKLKIKDVINEAVDEYLKQYNNI